MSKLPDISACHRALFALIAKAYGADNHTAAIIADVEMNLWAGEIMTASSAQQIVHAIEQRCVKL